MLLLLREAGGGRGGGTETIFPGTPESLHELKIESAGLRPHLQSVLTAEGLKDLSEERIPSILLEDLQEILDWSSGVQDTAEDEKSRGRRRSPCVCCSGGGGGGGQESREKPFPIHGCCGRRPLLLLLLSLLHLQMVWRFCYCCSGLVIPLFLEELRELDLDHDEILVQVLESRLHP